MRLPRTKSCVWRNSLSWKMKVRRSLEKVRLFVIMHQKNGKKKKQTLIKRTVLRQLNKKLWHENEGSKTFRLRHLWGIFSWNFFKTVLRCLNCYKIIGNALLLSYKKKNVSHRIEATGYIRLPQFPTKLKWLYLKWNKKHNSTLLELLQSLEMGLEALASTNVLESKRPP